MCARLSISCRLSTVLCLPHSSWTSRGELYRSSRTSSSATSKMPTRFSIQPFSRPVSVPPGKLFWGVFRGPSQEHASTRHVLDFIEQQQSEQPKHSVSATVLLVMAMFRLYKLWVVAVLVLSACNVAMATVYWMRAVMIGSIDLSVSNLRVRCDPRACCAVIQTPSSVTGPLDSSFCGVGPI